MARSLLSSRERDTLAHLSELLVAYRAVEMPAAAAMTQEVPALAGLPAGYILAFAAIVTDALAHICCS